MKNHQVLWRHKSGENNKSGIVFMSYDKKGDMSFEGIKGKKFGWICSVSRNLTRWYV